MIFRICSDPYKKYGVVRVKYGRRTGKLRVCKVRVVAENPGSLCFSTCLYGVSTVCARLFDGLCPKPSLSYHKTCHERKKTVSGLNDALEMCDMTFVRVSGFVQMDLI